MSNILRAIYALLISSQIEEDLEGLGRRDDNLLVGRNFKIPLPPYEDTIRWYKEKGFDVRTDYIKLSWDNYRKVCNC